MNVWAIVPVKPFQRAKSRLADVLVPEQREMLAAGLMTRTVRLLLPLPQIQGVLVISRDTKALSMARDLGAQTVQESGAPELNNALFRATHAIRAWGADAALIVPADIPLLAAEDIQQVVMAGRGANSVVIVPDRHAHGTNMLFVHPSGLIPYSFGVDSFAEHQRLAREANANLVIHQSERAALDLDTPGDLAVYCELANRMAEPIIEGIGPEIYV
ncbi:MAG: 2-phospho-L-lactate guanylyltransferase [Anaerolineae bacterium]|nr:2-phospho-L-lactate guanylyltransferase [Anaerolineae bacterium]